MMKNGMAIGIGIALTMILLFGCSAGSNRGGEVTKDQGFKVSVPILEFAKQGETVIVNGKVKREKGFNQDVRLEISAQQGLTVSPTETVIKATDKPEFPMQITASPNTAPGQYLVTVKGIPQRGAPVLTEMKMSVSRP